MTGYEVEILDVSLDFEQSISIPIDFSISEARDFTSRKRNVSKEIVFSGTDKNVNFFKGSFQFSSTENGMSFDPLSKQVAKIKKGGKVILLGVAKLNEVQILKGNLSFLVNIYSDISDIFLTFQNVKVSELDWSAYDHILSKANVQATWSATAGSGYYYPIIERGLPRLAPNKFRTTDLVPYVYVKEVIEKAFALVGCSVSSTHINTTDFKNILFGYGGGELNLVTPTDIANRIVSLSNGTINANLIGWQLAHNQTNFNPVQLTAFTLTEVQDVLNQHLGGEITITRSGNYNFNIGATANYIGQVLDEVGGTQSASNVIAGKIGILKNGIFTGVNLPITTGTALTFSQTIAFSTNLFCQVGDVITFEITPPQIAYNTPFDYTNNTWKAWQATLSLQMSNLTLLMTSLDETISDGDLVRISSVLPEMKLSDFLTGLVRKENLYISDPDENRIVKIEPLPKYYEDASTAKDVSHLVDENKIISIKPSGNEIAKTLRWKFKDNKDAEAERYRQTWLKDYGDYTLEQSSYYAKGEQVIEIPFSTIIPYDVTANSPFTSSNIYAPRFVKMNENGTIQPNKGEPRIMYRCPLVSGTMVFTDSAGGNPTTINNLPLVHHFNSYTNPTNDINFQLVEELYYPATIVTTKNSFTEYYSESTNEMISKAGKLMSLYLYWNEVDIYNLRFQQLLKINGTLWRLNKIADFDNSKAASTKFELLKVLQPKKRRAVQEAYTDLAMKSPTSYNAVTYVWSAVLNLDGSGNLRIANVLTNTGAFNIIPATEATGLYYLNGFSNLGETTVLTQPSPADNNEFILPTVASPTSILISTYQGGSLHGDVLPSLADNGYNYVLTVEIYQ